MKTYIIDNGFAYADREILFVTSDAYLEEMQCLVTIRYNYSDNGAKVIAVAEGIQCLEGWAPWYLNDWFPYPRLEQTGPGFEWHDKQRKLLEPFKHLWTKDK